MYEKSCNLLMKSHVTFFSMDENSYVLSCPNDACMKKERRKFMLGEHQTKDESKTWKPLNDMLWFPNGID